MFIKKHQHSITHSLFYYYYIRIYYINVINTIKSKNVVTEFWSLFINTTTGCIEMWLWIKKQEPRKEHVLGRMESVNPSWTPDTPSSSPVIRKKQPDQLDWRRSLIGRRGIGATPARPCDRITNYRISVTGSSLVAYWYNVVHRSNETGVSNAILRLWCHCLGVTYMIPRPY
jgi:hypothetical protein